MPRKRKKKLRPKLPSRVKKTRTKRSARAQNQHPELWGLGSVALGLFLGAVIYFGWNGGYVGRALADGLDALIGGASWGMPVTLVVLHSFALRFQQARHLVGQHAERIVHLATATRPPSRSSRQ